MSLSRPLHLARLFSTYSSLRPEFRRIVGNSINQWKSKPLDRKFLLKSLRLSGLTAQFSAVFLRRAECQARLSKRSDIAKREREHDPEASLTLSDIFTLIKPYLGWLIAAVVCAVLSAIINIKIPLCLGDLVNVLVDVIKSESKDVAAHFDEIKPHAVRLLTYYGIQAVLTFMYISFLTILGERMAVDMRLNLFKKLLSLDMSFFDTQKTGELSSRLNTDVQEFKSSFKLCVSQGLRTIAQTLGCIGSLVTLSAKMTLYTVAVVPGIILMGSIFGAALRVLSRKAQAQSAAAAATADEAFGNIRTVRAFAMEKQEEKLFEEELRKSCQLQEQLGFGVGMFQGATNLFLNGIVLSVLYGGASLIAQNEMSPGALMSFLVSAQTIQRSLSQLSIIFGTAVKGWTAGARVMQFSKMEPSIRMDDGVCIPYHTLWGDIRFENVSFYYPNRPGHKVFDDLDLEIPAGQIVALCGPSGEGKSTITHMLERFYEPQNGRVTLDGQDLRDLNVEWLRGRVIGLISQEPVLFATTIEDNIRYGRPEATDEEVRQAALSANVDEFVRKFPNGYQTVVGERGAQLSGGQKQRIAIARAILKNPPILILDEATSALDSESEIMVQDALNSVMKGRTVLIIAHRLSTIRDAQLIYVIKDKKAIEKGTHDQLMRNKNSIYKKLVEAQQIK
ncbi:unnamed protein product [Caenorhabditis auriculariae]|uniref:Mitochondrial potassium channel ATP-binding subunit n=1 Tax=Caenorhabditis auriculariae TaxID=2777116 RepID=A0A8S1GSJ2_9PELO|nr:unnamed protein product [Caenorhabditis auriculariae]